VSDSLADYEMAPSIMHRCRPPTRARRGARFECPCGMHYVYVVGAFAGWQPTTAADVPAPPVKRHGRSGGTGKGRTTAQSDRV
jgi:hypothetical protein